MEHKIYQMEIIDHNKEGYLIKLSDHRECCHVRFEPREKKLEFVENEGFIMTFKNNEYQLRKMLHNKRLDTYFVGFKLTFVFTSGKDIAAYNDRGKILVLDKRQVPNKNYVLAKGVKSIDKLYTDASYNEKYGRGGIVFIHENTDGKYTLYHEAVQGESSNLLELIAAIRGLEVLSDVEKIRIVTDSQYVRKGLTEWIIYWELNDWMTVNGEKVKNIDYWKRFNELSKGKYLEFEWVKAHSDHFENTLCDLYAKELSHT
ncbi:ribonuclease HI [Acidaminobacter sp. JC074]|uniref:ribonuclease H family protein n=1 Tax=Acidaminobacter sp. JC074 TaxID=2530199 RepID=UPI001F1088E0|nr:ribonuclease HI [Acidaminobacter sp. JC074]MCH4886580.1 ribonuclease HI [Acidaminobacter sp. JC074]